MDTPDSPAEQSGQQDQRNASVDQHAGGDVSQNGVGDQGGTSGTDQAPGAETKALVPVESQTGDGNKADTDDEDAKKAKQAQRENEALRQSYDLVGSHQIDPGTALRAIVFLMIMHGMPVETFQEAVFKVSAFEPAAAEEPAA